MMDTSEFAEEALLPNDGVNGFQQSQDFDDIDFGLEAKMEQTEMWAQQQYLTDSGIHSVMSTTAPSISSQMQPDDLDRPMQAGAEVDCSDLPFWGSGPGSVFQQDMAGILSPETPLSSSGGTSNTPIPMDTGVGMPLHIGMHFDEASDLADAASALPDLIPLLEDEDIMIINQASMMINQLAKSRGGLDTMINTPGMVPALIRAMNLAEPEPARYLTGTLYQMSQTPNGLAVIFASQGVPALINQLSSNIEVIQFYSITTLHNLLLHQDGAKDEVRSCNGIPVMVQLLKKNNQKFLAICTDCLQLLAFRHNDTKMKICMAGGPAELVQILLNYNYEKLLWTTTRVLKVLSVCPTSKIAIIKAGGVEALTKHLTRAPHEAKGPTPSQRLLHNCLWTLRNLSDSATSQEDVGPLFERLIYLLCCPEPSIISCSAGILANLTCNNQKNKQAVCASGGIRALIEAIKKAKENEEITEPCVCALRHLTSRHEEARRAQESVRFFDGVSMLNYLFQLPTTWSLRKAVVGLARNLALSSGNHTTLRDHGVLHHLIKVLESTHREMSGYMQANPQQPITETSFKVSGVRLDEVAEGCCGALQLLARDADSRSLMSKEILVLCCYLLFIPSEQVHMGSLGLLHELSNESEVVTFLMQDKLSVRIMDLAQNVNETTRNYAVNILGRLPHGYGGEANTNTTPTSSPGSNQMMEDVKPIIIPNNNTKANTVVRPPNAVVQQQGSVPVPPLYRGGSASNGSLMHQQYQPMQQQPPVIHQQQYPTIQQQQPYSHYPQQQQQYPAHYGGYHPIPTEYPAPQRGYYSPHPQTSGWSSGTSSGFASPGPASHHAHGFASPVPAPHHGFASPAHHPANFASPGPQGHHAAGHSPWELHNSHHYP